MVASTISQRLQQAMDEKDMTQRALARAVGIRQQSIFYLLHATKGVVPKTRYLAKIADVLGVDPIWLETGTGDPKGGKIVTSGGKRIGRRIPIYSRSTVVKKVVDNLQEMTCDTDETDAFGYDVPDAAMEPDIRRDDRVVIAPKRKIAPGRVGLFLVDGQPELRRFRAQGTGKAQKFTLVASHPDYPSFSSDANDIKLMGPVAEQRRFIAA